MEVYNAVHADKAWVLWHDRQENADKAVLEYDRVTDFILSSLSTVQLLLNDIPNQPQQRNFNMGR